MHRIALPLQTRATSFLPHGGSALGGIASRRAMLALTSTAALTLGAGPALAQEAAQASQPEPASELSEIVVTGYRASNLATVQAKRELEGVTDSIAADEIGGLPDYNLAEALQRVPGVSTDQDNGEDRFVIVRGFNPEYNFTTVDGLILPSTDNASRAVLLDVVPSSVVGRVDVRKSFSADLDGQSIGGNINLKTRSAFDRGRAFFAANASVGAWEYDDEGPDKIDPSIRGDAAFSTLFGLDDQFGIVIAGNYWKRDTYALSPTVSGTAPYRFYDADRRPLSTVLTPEEESQVAFIAPANSSMFLYHSERERVGGLVKLEYKAADRDLYAYAQAFRFQRQDNERRDHERIENSDLNIAPADLTPTSGRIVGRAQTVVEGLEQRFKDVMQGVQSGLDLGLGRAGRLEVRAGYARATLDNPVLTATYNNPSSLAQGYSYQFGADGVPVATPGNLAVYENTDNYRLYQAVFDEKSNRETVFEGRLDYSYNLDRGDTGLGIKAGGVVRRFDREKDNERQAYRPAVPTLLSAALLDHRYLAQSFTAPMLFVDVDAVRGFDFTNPRLFTYQASSVTTSTSGDYDLSEDVTAAYAMGVWRAADWQARVGLRYEHTDLSAAAMQLRDGVLSPFSTGSDYDNWLPSADITYDITPRLRIKAAFSRSLGRPDYDDVAPYRTVSLDAADGEATISGGNPDLRPRRSDNYDLSVEYYLPDRNGLVSAGLFHKKVRDEIYDLNTLVPDVAFEGATVDILYRRPENAENASLTGVEVGAIVNSFTFLPGALANFGMSANYAYIKSDIDIVVSSDPATGTVVTRPLYGLFLQPKHVANVSLIYKQEAFEGRIAWNYKSKHLRSIASITQPWADRFYDDRSTIDAQLRYALSPHVRLFVEGKNLTGSYAHEINTLGLHHTKRDTGRSFWAGVSYRF